MRSLRYRIAGWIIAIEIVMLSILLWNNDRIMERVFSERLQDSAYNITNQFAATARSYIFEYDLASLSEHANSVLSHDELIYIAVDDNAGRRLLDVGATPPAPIITDTSVEDVTDGVFDTESPIEIAGRPLGVARLGFTLGVKDEAVAGATVRGVILALGVVVLSVVVALIVGNRLTRDLRRLATAADRFGRGEADVKVDIATSDEVGQTAQAFNRMVVDHTQTQEARRQSESRFRALIEHAVDLIGLVRPDGEILFVSPSIKSILGYEPSELVGRNTMDIIHPDDAGAWGDVVGKLLESPELVAQTSFRVRHADGSWRYLEAKVRNRLNTPAVGAIVFNSQDVTERRIMEEQLRRSQSLEAIGGLTGGLAHDFNNLLAVISGNLDLMAEELDDKPALRDMAERAIRAAERGATLTRSLLAFSRQQLLQAVDIDANAVVEEVTELIRRTLPADIAVTPHCQPGLWRCHVDVGQLQNALLNLALNARDAMPDGGALTIETSNVTLSDKAAGLDLEPGDYVCLSVSDNGVGMSQDVADRAFEPFFTTKDVGKGSGLGLSMIHGFANQSGGQACIVSDVGRGTSVSIYLARSTRDAEPGPALGGDARPVGSEKILLVEDDADVRALVDSMLGTLGYQVVPAGDGDEGLRILEQQDGFALLLSDVMLPGGIKGPALIARAMAMCPGLRVLLMSGYAEDSVFSDDGLDEDVVLLRKPFTRAELARGVRDALDR